MPIEIKELVIRANVVDGQHNSQKSENEELKGSGGVPFDEKMVKMRKAILEECQHMIVEYFSRMNER